MQRYKLLSCGILFFFAYRMRVFHCSQRQLRQLRTFYGWKKTRLEWDTLCGHSLKARSLINEVTSVNWPTARNKVKYMVSYVWNVSYIKLFFVCLCVCVFFFSSHLTRTNFINSGELQPVKFALFHTPSAEHFRNAVPREKIGRALFTTERYERKFITAKILEVTTEDKAV